MKFIPVAALAASLLFTVPATAETAAAQSEIKSDKAKSDKAEKKECRRLAVSGTRMTERVCLSKEDWQKVDQNVEE